MHWPLRSRTLTAHYAARQGTVWCSGRSTLTAQTTSNHRTTTCRAEASTGLLWHLAICSQSRCVTPQCGGASLRAWQTSNGSDPADQLQRRRHALLMRSGTSRSMAGQCYCGNRHRCPGWQDSAYAVDSGDTHMTAIAEARTAAGHCMDASPRCAEWAAAGECNRNPTFMTSAGSVASMRHDQSAASDTSPHQCRALPAFGYIPQHCLRTETVCRPCQLLSPWQTTMAA